MDTKELVVGQDVYVERRVAQAFDLVGISNAVGAPLLRSLQGRESECMRRGSLIAPPQQIT